MKTNRFIVLASVLALTSCSAPRVITMEKPLVVKDTICLTRFRVDSVSVHHYHTEKDSNGVIVIRDSVDRQHNNIIHDSIDRIIKIPVITEIPVPFEVPRKKSLLENVLIDFGKLGLVSWFFALCYIVFKVWRKFK